MFTFGDAEKYGRDDSRTVSSIRLEKVAQLRKKPYIGLILREQLLCPTKSYRYEKKNAVLPPPSIYSLILLLTLCCCTGCSDETADNPKPEDNRLTLTLAPDAVRPYFQAEVTIKTVDAKSLRLGWFTTDRLTEILSSGKTIQEYLLENTDPCFDDLLETANAAGLKWYLSYLTSGNSYTFIATAELQNGDTVTKSIPYTTPRYIDPQARWEVVSTNAACDAGMLWLFCQEESRFESLPIRGLTVEKMEGKDFFRIADLFTSVEDQFQGTNLTLGTEHGYFLIDATDPQDVKVEPYESRINLQYDGQPMNCGSTVLFNLLDIDEIPDYTQPGTYDAKTGIIDLKKMCVEMGGMVYLSSASNTVLYLHGK